MANKSRSAEVIDGKIDKYIITEKLIVFFSIPLVFFNK